MPRRKFIDKKTATNFRLVHRAQNDPRIHDEDAPQMVFAETTAPNTRAEPEPAGSSRTSQYSAATGRSKIRSRRDLEGEFEAGVRQNEGEAANYGVFFDDSEYDYMQHLRDLGTGGGDAYFVEAPGEKKRGKQKQKFDLAAALQNVSLEDGKSQAGMSMNSNVSSVSDLFGEDMAPSEFVRKTTYQDQQNVPDAIAGFQPDMDPRLREVLEALNDEAYIDDEDDIFAKLAEDGYEVDQREWDESGYEEQDTMNRFLDEDDAGWETDDTIKAASSKTKENPDSEGGVPIYPPDLSSLPAPDQAPAPTEPTDLVYLSEFQKFKNAKSSAPTPHDAPSDMQSSILTGASALKSGGRKKKRKGALTSTSSYSMTSSALHRTEGLTLLDQRFDKLEELYAVNELADFPDNVSLASGTSRLSSLSKISEVSGWSRSSEAGPQQMRSDFDGIMDEFLEEHHIVGRGRVRRGKEKSGLEQLEEVRRGLGPARVGAKAQRA